MQTLIASLSFCLILVTISWGLCVCSKKKRERSKKSTKAVSSNERRVKQSDNGKPESNESENTGSLSLATARSITRQPSTNAIAADIPPVLVNKSMRTKMKMKKATPVLSVIDEEKNSTMSVMADGARSLALQSMTDEDEDHDDEEAAAMVANGGSSDSRSRRYAVIPNKKSTRADLRSLEMQTCPPKDPSTRKFVKSTSVTVVKSQSCDPSRMAPVTATIGDSTFVYLEQFSFPSHMHSQAPRIHSRTPPSEYSSVTQSQSLTMKNEEAKN